MIDRGILQCFPMKYQNLASRHSENDAKEIIVKVLYDVLDILHN
jgi:hypothetical protein